MLLRDDRLAAGVELAAVQEALKLGASMVSKLEYGRRGIKASHVKTLAKLYRLDDETTRSRIDLAISAEAPAWWSPYRVPEHYQQYVGLETGADKVRTFELVYVPGLFQTEDYARASHARSPRQMSDVEIARSTGLRRARQARLHTKDHPLKVDAIISEAALRCMVGGPEVMAAQALHLAELSRSKNITIHVLPGQVHHEAMFGPYSLVTFAEMPDLDTVYLEHYRGLYLERPEQVGEFKQTHESLRKRAMGIEETRTWLVNLASDLSAKQGAQHGKEVAQE